MTKEPSDREADNATLGAILGGMIAFDQSISNRLNDSHIDTAIDWATRFKMLYRWVERVNRDILVRDALDQFYWDNQDADRAIEHLNSLRMVNRA